MISTNFAINKNKYSNDICDDESHVSAFDRNVHQSHLESNMCTVKELIDRSDIPIETVSLICQYISSAPLKRNTRFKGTREEFTICSNSSNFADIRIFGSGASSFNNFTSGASGGSSGETILKAYTASKIIATKITLYASDSGLGNDLLTTCNIYKMPADAFSKAHVTLLSDNENTEARVTLDTNTTSSFVIKGNWSQPLIGIDSYTTLSEPQIIISNQQVANLTSKYIGSSGIYLLTNVGLLSITVTPYLYTRFGVSTTASPITIQPGASSIYNVNQGVEPYKFVSDTGSFYVTCQKDLESGAEDMYVKITSNNNTVSMIVEKVYEVEIADDLTLDIKSDDHLRFFSGDTYYQRNNDFHLKSGQAFLGKLLTSVVSIAGPPIIDRFKSTWNQFKYDSSSNILSNLKDFIQLFSGSDRNKDNSKRSNSNIGSASCGKIGYASTGLSLNDVFMTTRKMKDNNKSGNKVDLYGENHGFPVFESLGFSPLMANLKGKVQPDFKHVIEVAFPSGFQYLPVIIDGKYVVTIGLAKSHTPVSGVSYSEPYKLATKNKKVCRFDARIQIEENTKKDILFFLSEGHGCYKNFLFDIYITLDMPKDIARVEDRSWLAAYAALILDCPDGLFLTGGFEYINGRLKLLPILDKAYTLKASKVKKLILMTDEDSILALRSRSSEDLTMYNMPNAFMCATFPGFWDVTIRSHASLGITRDTYKDNRVLVCHDKEGNVAFNFRYQFAAILSQNPNTTPDFYSQVLGGQWHLIKQRLFIPIAGWIGIRQRELNTFTALGNVESDKGKAKFSNEIDTDILLRWLYFGYDHTKLADHVPPADVVAVEGNAKAIVPAEMSYEVFMNAPAIDILNTFADAKGFNLEKISATRKMPSEAHPSLHALQKIWLILNDNKIYAPKQVASMMYTYVMNVRDKIRGTTQASLKYKMFDTAFTPSYDNYHKIYTIGAFNYIFLIEEMTRFIGEITQYFDEKKRKIYAKPQVDDIYDINYIPAKPKEIKKEKDVPIKKVEEIKKKPQPKIIDEILDSDIDEEAKENAVQFGDVVDF